jgi:hypothetical protein
LAYFKRRYGCHSRELGAVPGRQSRACGLRHTAIGPVPARDIGWELFGGEKFLTQLAKGKAASFAEAKADEEAELAARMRRTPPNIRRKTGAPMSITRQRLMISGAAATVLPART